MFKKLLSLLLALVLCISLIACGEDSRRDDDDAEEDKSPAADGIADIGGVGVAGDAVINSIKNNEVVAFVADDDADSVRISLGVDNLAKIAEMSGEQIPMELGGADIGIYLDWEELRALFTASAELENKDIDLSAYIDEEDIIVSTNLLNDAYGMKTADVVALAKAGMEISSALMSQMVDLGEFEDLGDYMDFFKLIMDLSVKYSGTVIDLIGEHMVVEEERDGDFIVHSFTFTGKEFGKVMGDLIEIMIEDEDLDIVAETFGVDIDSITEQIEAEMSQIEFTVEGEYLTPKKSSMILEFEVTLDDGNEEIAIFYEFNEKNGDFEAEFVLENGNKIEAEGTVEDDGSFECDVKFIADGEETGLIKIDYSDVVLNFAMYEDGEELQKFALQYGDGEYSLRMYEDGEDYMAMVIEYEDGEFAFTVTDFGEEIFCFDGEYDNDGDTFRLEPHKISMEDMEIDLEAFGIYLEIEKNPTFPSVSDRYTEFDMTDSGMLNDIQMELVQKLMKMFPELASGY